MTLIRNATLLTVIALLTILNTGCEPENTESRAVVCTVVVDPPANAEDSDKIVARARFRCEDPGAEVLTVKLRIEKRDGEQWHSVASRTFTLRGKDNYAQGLKYQSRQIEIACASGTFRTVADWSRTSKKDTKGDNLVSGQMADPCNPLFRIS